MPDIEEQIRRAQEQGQFDDLPGKGEPLRLDQNPHEDPEWRLAHQILRDGGFSLPWIEMWREIQLEITHARTALRRTWDWRCKAIAKGQPDELIKGEWMRAEKNFRDAVDRLNKRITNYNLGVPSEHFQRRTLNAEREIEALEGETPDGQE